MRQITIFLNRNNIHEMKLWRIRIGIYLWPEYQQIDSWRIYFWPIRELFVNIELFAEHWYKNIRKKKKMMCHLSRVTCHLSTITYHLPGTCNQTTSLCRLIYYVSPSMVIAKNLFHYRFFIWVI